MAAPEAGFRAFRVNFVRASRDSARYEPCARSLGRVGHTARLACRKRVNPRIGEIGEPCVFFGCVRSRRHLRWRRNIQRDYPEAAPLSGERDPRIGTVMKVPGALGVRLTVASKVGLTPATDRGGRSGLSRRLPRRR